MTRTLTALAAITLLGSAAAAQTYRDAIDAKLEAHWNCAFDAAMELVDAEGTPEALARKAVETCEAEEVALGWRAPYALASTETRLVGIIYAERKVPPMFRGKARTRPAADLTRLAPSRHCPDCGFMRQWDDRLKIWRRSPNPRR